MRNVSRRHQEHSSAFDELKKGTLFGSQLNLIEQKAIQKKLFNFRSLPGFY